MPQLLAFGAAFSRSFSAAIRGAAAERTALSDGYRTIGGQIYYVADGMVLCAAAGETCADPNGCEVTSLAMALAGAGLTFFCLDPGETPAAMLAATASDQDSFILCRVYSGCLKAA